MNSGRLLVPVLYTLTAAVCGFAGGALSEDARGLLWRPASAGAGQVISASEFRLLDEGGKVRARLFLAGPYEPKLTLYDWRGGEDEQVSLAATSIGVQLTLSYSSALLDKVPAPQQGQIQLWAQQEGGFLKIGRKNTVPEIDLSASHFFTGLNLASATDHKRAIQASVGNARGASVFVLLRDHNEKQRAGLELDSEDHPSFYLFDQNEEARANLGLDALDDPSLSLSDARGKLRSVMGSVGLQDMKTGSTTHRSPSSLVLFGENGRVLWEVP
jgi:hypothetical protein